MRQFGLIGFPLTHSFSAQYFKKKFADEQIMNADYQLIPLEDISLLPALLEQHPDLLGLNVTIPHKIAILPYLHSLSNEATAVGAVNCVKIERKTTGLILTGYNTDIYGFRESLLTVLKPFHHNALVLGTGGAAKAVCYILNQLGIVFKMVSRSCQGEKYLQYSQLSQKNISENTLIINTTPIGTYPETDNCPDIPYKFLGSRHLLFDLIYNPAETKFLKMGREAGAIVINGQRMLELQAEKSFEIWNE